MADHTKLNNSENEIRRLDREITKLEEHKAQLNNKLANQVHTIKNVYSDPEYQEKISKTTEEIK